MFNLEIVAARILNSVKLLFLVSSWSSKTAHTLALSTFYPIFDLYNVQCVHNWTDCCLPNIVLVQSQTLLGNWSLNDWSLMIFVILEKSVVRLQITFYEMGHQMWLFIWLLDLWRHRCGFESERLFLFTFINYFKLSSAGKSWSYRLPFIDVFCFISCWLLITEQDLCLLWLELRWKNTQTMCSLSISVVFARFQCNLKLIRFPWGEFWP